MLAELLLLSDKFRAMSGNEGEGNRGALLAALLLLAESILVFTLGVYMVALGFTHDKSWMPYLSVIGFAFAGAAGLFTLSRGVKSGKRWANSPAILANLIALGVAKYQFEAGLYWLAFPITAMAISVVTSIFISLKNSK